MRLSIFAYHVQQITEQKESDPETQYSPCEGVTVKVAVVSNISCKLYTVNGRGVGNVHGAIDEFTKIVNEAKPEIEYS